MHKNLKKSIVVCGLAFALGAAAPVLAFAETDSQGEAATAASSMDYGDSAVVAEAPSVASTEFKSSDSVVVGSDVLPNSDVENSAHEDNQITENLNTEFTENAKKVSASLEDEKSNAIDADEVEPPLEDGTYVIGSGNYKGLSKVVDVWHNKEYSHANVQLYENNNTAAQQWDFVHKGNGYYTIAKHGTKLMLQVTGEQGIVKANIEIDAEKEDCDAQLWFLKSLSNGAYNLVSKLNKNLVIDVYGGRVENESNVQLYQSNNTQAQRFYIYKAHPEVAVSDIDKPSSAHFITTANNQNYTIGVKGGSKSNGANVQLEKVTSNSQLQKLYLQNAGDGFYYINLMGTGKVLTMKNSVVNGSNVYQDSKRGLNNQKWALRSNPDGSFRLINKATGLLLDVSGGKNRSGINLQGFIANGTSAQNFNLQKTSLIDEGIYTIDSFINPNKVFDVTSGRNTSGTAVRMFSSNGTRAQRFEIKKIDGYENVYRFRTAASGGWLTFNPEKGFIQDGDSTTVANEHNQWDLAWNGNAFSLYSLAVPNRVLGLGSGQVHDGSSLSLYEPTDSYSYFVFNPAQLVADGTYKIVSQLGTVLGANRTDNKNGGNISAGRFRNFDSQKFQVTNVGNNVVTLKNANSDKLVEIYHGSSAAGANVCQFQSNGTAAQKWVVEIADGGWLSFKNLKSGLVLDISGASKADGANVHQWENNNTAAQKWIIQDTSHWDLSGGKYVYVNEKGKRSNWKYSTYVTYRKINNLSSGTKYIITIDQSRFYVNVYHLENDTWVPHKIFRCSVGKPESPTPKGLFRTSGKKAYYGDMGPNGIIYETGEYYWTEFYKTPGMGPSFHSLLYYAKTKILYPYVNKLGARQSGACCRLEIGNAKWVYDNITRGTTCLSY